MKSPEFSSQEPIIESPETISYLGVQLEKSKNRENAPDPKIYEDYIDDKFTLSLQRDIAVSFSQGDPILIEGGTSIGKTTTLKKMAAELGWEVHYVNLNGATDASDLMGRYIPNPNKRSESDPEYIFADGSVTSGLRVEEDKIKLIILDELNASSPANLIRLHEILDAVERSGDVVLSEDASEKISTDRKSTKIAALINPPGKGFMQREALDPAQLRRWVYMKAPSELPDESFFTSTRSLFGIDSGTQQIPNEAFLYTNESTLTPKDLVEIPGMEEILDKYQEFHKATKELVKMRTVASDQPQPFSYDDRMEPRRVRDFVCRFYRGDLTETFQQALRYYYAGKVISVSDKKKMEELIKLVNVPKHLASNKKRKGLNINTPDQKSPEAISLKDARKIFEDLGYPEGFIGPEEVAEACGFKKIPEAPPIPFSREVLEKSKSLGLQLVLQVGKTEEGENLTIEKMESLIMGRGGSSKVIYKNISLASDSDIINIVSKETPRYGWKLVETEKSSVTEGSFMDTLGVNIDILSDFLYEDKSQESSRFKKVREEYDISLKVPFMGDLKSFRPNNMLGERPSEMVYRAMINSRRPEFDDVEEGVDFWSNFVTDDKESAICISRGVGGVLAIGKKSINDEETKRICATMYT